MSTKPTHAGDLPTSTDGGELSRVCPSCGAAELIRDTRDIRYVYKGEQTTIAEVTGDFCASCGEVVLNREDGDRYSELVSAFQQQVNTLSGHEKGVTKPFPELRSPMSPQSQQRSLVQAQEMLAAMQYPSHFDANELRQVGNNLDDVLAAKSVSVDELVEEFKNAKNGHRG